MSAIKLLKSNDIQYKKYNLDTFEGGLEHVLDCLIEYKDVVNFDPKHKTRPLVFYKGKFIGGFRELKETL
jgi:glutaredoxin